MIDLSVLTEKASLVAKEAGTYLRKDNAPSTDRGRAQEHECAR